MKRFGLILCFCVIALAAAAQYNYPPSKMVDSTHTYFGVTYHDPYGWLENMKDHEVVSWFKKQAEFTDQLMSHISGRDELIAEWRKLDRLQPAQVSDPVYENGRYFYRKTQPGEPVGKLYYRQGQSGKEILLFDPLNFIAGKVLSISGFVPSHDGKRVAIAYTQQGAEVSTIKIMDVATRNFLTDEIFPALAVEGFAFDNSAILYLDLKSADNTNLQAQQNLETKLHRIGQPVASDASLFSAAAYPELNFPGYMYPGIGLFEEVPQYAYAAVLSVRPEVQSWFAPIATLKDKHIPWKVFSTTEDSLVGQAQVIGHKVYAMSHNKAPNFKLLCTSLDHPDWQHATVIAAEKKGMKLIELSHSRNFIFLVYSDGINTHLEQYNPATGRITTLNLPLSGTATITCLNKKTNQCLVSVTSWVSPRTVFDYDADRGLFKPDPFTKPLQLPAAYAALQVTETEVKGHDGTMVPLTIIYKKGLKKDGNNVCLMDSYGAYGESMLPNFSARRMALAIKGVVIAIPHVRGGGEKGEAWYKGGYKLTKPNTWKDFNSCAEYLITQGYTKPSKLAGTGTSAGGILISRAITERPDLFAAALCNVGVADALRTEFTVTGPVNIPEFGTVKDSAECRALYEMDGVQHVVKGQKYPAVMCIAGWHDPRVMAWEPGKFAAALQNASASGKPVLMKVNYDNGHFTEDKEVTWANFADQLAFVMWQCGHPDFQPKP